MDPEFQFFIVFGHQAGRFAAFRPEFKGRYDHVLQEIQLAAAVRFVQGFLGALVDVDMLQPVCGLKT